MMKWLDFKEARRSFGWPASLKPKKPKAASQSNKIFPDTKNFCCLSFLHDEQRGEAWAKQQREIIKREEL